MNRIFLFLVSIFSIISCNNIEQIELTVKAGYSENDTLIIKELITDKVLAKLSANRKGATNIFNIDYPTAGVLTSQALGKNYLLCLQPNKKFEISISKDKQIRSTNTCDSILNYLHSSNNEFIGNESGFIFSTNNYDSIVAIFDQFKMNREKIILENKKDLTSEEFDFLKFQNSARIYAFLYYFGRIAKQIDLKSSYYDFSKNIDVESEWFKTLPDIIIYKYEVDFVRENDSINDIVSFTKYMKSKCKDNDQSDFLIARYLEGLISHPSYWTQHEKYLSTEVLKTIVESEKDNKYFSIIKKTSDSYFKSQKGEIAYNFTAIDKAGNEVQLKDFAGKIVFIDAWATWCGPCLKHRPAIKDFAKKYQDNSDVAILMVSVDEKIDRWLDFIGKDNPNSHGLDLYIENGQETKFGNSYNVKAIPKYILIDKKGIIYNADISEPSMILEETIEKLLKQ